MMSMKTPPMILSCAQFHTLLRCRLLAMQSAENIFSANMRSPEMPSHAPPCYHQRVRSAIYNYFHVRGFSNDDIQMHAASVFQRRASAWRWFFISPPLIGSFDESAELSDLLIFFLCFKSAAYIDRLFCIYFAISWQRAFAFLICVGYAARSILHTIDSYLGARLPRCGKKALIMPYAMQFMILLIGLRKCHAYYASLMGYDSMRLQAMRHTPWRPAVMQAFLWWHGRYDAISHFWYWHTSACKNTL